jgi:hypothetical protein
MMVDWQRVEDGLRDLRERAMREPAVGHPSDITSLDGLCDLPTNLIKVTTDGGASWQYRIVGKYVDWAKGGDISVSALQLTSTGSSVVSLPITESDFARSGFGFIVRAVSKKEVRELGLDPSLRVLVTGHGVIRRGLDVLRDFRDGVDLPTGELSASSIAAADWWANQLGRTPGSVAREYSNRFGVGDPAVGLFIDSGAHESISPEAIDRFRTELARRIEALPTIVGLGKEVGIDYDPDTTLMLAARSAGVPTDRFPWKTNMVITSTSVEVRGQQIWSAPTADGPNAGVSF